MKTVYVLHGHWETSDERGVKVVCVKEKEEDAIQQLQHIICTNASEYVSFVNITRDINSLEVYESDTCYEVRDMQDGDFVGFYITEEVLN